MIIIRDKVNIHWKAEPSAKHSQLLDESIPWIQQR